MVEQPMSRRPLKIREMKWVHELTKFLLKMNIRPDMISLLGIFFAVLAGLFFYSSQTSSVWCFLWAAVFVQMRLLCNMMDGMVAVEGNIKSKFGELFNEMPDRYEDIVILVGAGYAASHVAIGWAAAAIAVLTAYIRAFGASLGTKQYFCGPMAKPNRMFIVTVASLTDFFLQSTGRVLAIGLWIIVIGGVATVIRRTWLIVNEIKHR